MSPDPVASLGRGFIQSCELGKNGPRPWQLRVTLDTPVVTDLTVTRCKMVDERFNRFIMFPRNVDTLRFNSRLCSTTHQNCSTGVTTLCIIRSTVKTKLFSREQKNKKRGRPHHRSQHTVHRPDHSCSSIATLRSQSTYRGESPSWFHHAFRCPTSKETECNSRRSKLQMRSHCVTTRHSRAEVNSALLHPCHIERSE